MPLTLSKVHCLCRDCSPLSQGEGSDCLTSEGNHLPTDTVIPAGSPGPLGVRWGTEFFSGWVTCPHPPITVALTVLNKLLPKHGTQRFSADSTDPSALAVLPGLLNQNGLSFVLVAQSCSTLWDPIDCRPPGSSVHGIFPGKVPGVGCHCLPHGIFPTQAMNLGLLHYRKILYRLSYQN